MADLLLSDFDVERIASAIVAKLAAPRADELVDRRSCGAAGRLWDRIVATDPSVIKDGRRLVMRRDDFARALDRHRVVRAPVPAPADDLYQRSLAPRRASR